MHVGAKKIAFLGFFSALSVVFVVLGSVIESSTLCFLALASFGVGIVNREYGKHSMIGYFFASVFVSFLVVPNKLYCITFTAMSLYILITELAFELLDRKNGLMHKGKILWIIKYILFNIMFLPALFLFPHLLFASLKPSVWFLCLMIVAAQIFLLLYDKAYHYTQSVVWSKLRRYLQMKP